MAYIPSSSSVVAFQSDPTKLVGTVSVVGNMNSSVAVVSNVPQSVSGVGVFNINPLGNGSIIGTLINSSVAALQGTNPWKVELTSGSVITSGGNSSVQVVGQIPPMSVSGVGTFNINPVGSGSIIGILINSSVAALQGTNPWVVQTTGSVLTQYREDTVATSVIGYPLVFRRTDSASIMGIVSPANPLPISNSSVQIVGTIPTQSVMVVPGIGVLGSVATLQGTNPWVIGNSSVMLSAGINAVGSVAVLQGTNPFTVQTTGSVIAFVMGSVAAVGNTSVMLTAGTNAVGSIAVLQGTNPWVLGNTSVLLLPGLNVIGSVAVLQGTSPWITTTQASSIVGTYAEDAASADGDKGLFTLGIRNDAVASFVSADKDYTGTATDSAGRVLVKPFAPNESSIFGHSSTVNAGDIASILLIAGAGAGLKNYITDYQVSNTGSVSTLITFTEGGGSVLARTIAPAGGGSNMPGMMWPVSNVVPNQPINLVTGTASSTLYISFRGFKAP